MRANEIGVGVIGVGDMGARHALNIRDEIAGARLVAVMDADADRAAVFAEHAQVHATGEDLIADPSVEAVLIAAPDRTHGPFTLECVRQSKPVLCEKPLARTSAEARQIVEAEASTGRQLVQVGFMRHFDRRHLAVREALDSGAIGRPILFKGYHRNQSPVAYFDAEAIFLNSAIHDIQSARWLLDAEVEEVYVCGANTDPALGVDVCDLQIIQMRMSEGRLATIEVYPNSGYGYEVGVEIVGESGTVQTEPSSGAVVRAGNSRSQQVAAHWLERFQPAYLAELMSWVESIRKGEPIRPDARDGYASLAVAEACVESMKTARPVVPQFEHPASAGCLPSALARDARRTEKPPADAGGSEDAN